MFDIEGSFLLGVVVWSRPTRFPHAGSGCQDPIPTAIPIAGIASGQQVQTAQNQCALGQDVHQEAVVERQSAAAAGEFAFGFGYDAYPNLVND
jgi:hypothetical protein